MKDYPDKTKKYPSLNDFAKFALEVKKNII